VEASALPAPAAVARTRSSIGTHPPPPLLRLRSDEQLVALFRDGHDDAFRVIHDRYRQRLFAYTRQMLPQRQDAEDALQDIFVRAYAGLRANHRELALRAWLYRVAHNRCIDELRRPSPPPPEVLELLRSPVHDPIAEADRRESLRRLIADVRRLPDQQRSALLMRELSGMSYADMSAALEVTVPAVKSLLVRARMALAQALEARDTACSEIREELILSADRGLRPNGTARRHMRDCAGCREFRHELRGVSRRFAAIVPTLGPLGVLANMLGVGGAGGGAAGGAIAAGGAAGTTTAVGAGTAIVSVGTIGASATHVATILAAAVVTAGGAVELQHTLPAAPHHRHHRHPAPLVAPAVHAAAPAPGAVQSSDVGAAATPPATTAPPVRLPQVAGGPVEDSTTPTTETTSSSTTTVPADVTTQPTGGISTVISAGGVAPSAPTKSSSTPTDGSSSGLTNAPTASSAGSTSSSQNQSNSSSTTSPSSTTSSQTTTPSSPAGGSPGTATGTGSSTGAATGGSSAPTQ
jgi:RNA polymerase sigma factor (sigma-70 family)